MFFGGNPASFNPDKDIPSLEGKVILVTGGNIGLGKQAILEFARHGPRQIWLAARNLGRAKAAVDDIQLQVGYAPINILHVDLSSFESVKTAAQTFIAESDRLDILMLNAAIMGTSPGLSEEGYEIQFGTNHMGHALLTKLLLPVLDKTAKSSPDADVRIVSLSSMAHSMGPKEGIVFESLKTTAGDLSPIARYGQSKLANMLFARKLAKLHPHLTVASIHPGVVKTNLLSGASDMSKSLRMLIRLLFTFAALSVGEGAKNQLWASVSKDVKSGGYYKPIGILHEEEEPEKYDHLAEQLWDWTEQELGQYLATSGDGDRSPDTPLIEGDP